MPARRGRWARFDDVRSGGAREFAPEEVALALQWTCATAICRMRLAAALVERLPATLDALAAGVIDLPRCSITPIFAVAAATTQ
jgi:hypothetical protein